MGKLGTGRNNQLSANGLLYDSDGNVFDLTQWYKDNTLSIDVVSTNNQMIKLLKKIELHLSLMTGEELDLTDTE